MYYRGDYFYDFNSDWGYAVTVKKYKISTKTLNDIINTIPSDRWEIVMDELKTGLLHAKDSFDFASFLGVGHPKAEFQDPMTWIDDGKGKISIVFFLRQRKR